MKLTNRNKTFRNGPRQHLNACVGENSGTDNRNGYTLGFGDAVNVLLTAAMQEQYIDAITESAEGTFMDALIYPICFCARHYIELFLKREIQNISRIRRKFRASPMNHNLRTLWTDFLETCVISDRRLIALALPMGEYILDFAAVDPTGETFRYAQNRKNVEHLTEMGGVINLEVLGRRFAEMSVLIEEFEVQSEIIVNEYATGTYTTKLSRAELFELAEQLPLRDDWGVDEKFLTVKERYRKKYQLSSNDFQRAIRLIEVHPLLSAMIGRELALPNIGADLIDRLVAAHNYNSKIASVSDDEWAAVDAIYQIGRSFEYPEYYYEYCEDAREGIRDGTLDITHVLRQVFFPNRRFVVGLKKLGQSRLLKRAEILFPEP